MSKKNVKKYSGIWRLVLFICLFCTIFGILEKLFFDENNIHPTWKYVTNSEHEPIDILYVGNSHVYTSIDAEIMSLATGLNVRELTCSSINGEIVAIDLETFLNYEVPKVVVLEMCAFTTDNFEEMRTDKIGIVFQHFDGIPDTTTRFKAISQVADFENTFAGVFQLLRNTEMWSRWKPRNTKSSTFDEYGAGKKWGVYFNGALNIAEIEQLSMEHVPAEDEICMNERNREAMKKIIALSEMYGFDIWVYNAPLGYYSRNYANALDHVYSLQEQYPVIKYIDDSMLCLQEIGIAKTDYNDNAHLNSDGMQKVTAWMLGKIEERFNVTADTSAITRYHDASVQMIDADTFRYEVNAYSDVQYQFEYEDDDGNKILTGYSENNWLEETAIPKTKLFAHIMSPVTGESVKYPYLQYTLREYNVTISENTIIVENCSNFADDLMFAWDLVNSSNGTTKIFAENVWSKATVTLEESGVYQVYAHTLQNGVDRNDLILTVQYDAETNQITVQETLDCVNVK